MLYILYWLAFSKTTGNLFKQLGPIVLKMIEQSQEDSAQKQEVALPMSADDQSILVRDFAAKLQMNDFAAVAIFDDFTTVFADQVDQKLMAHLEMQLKTFDLGAAFDTLESICGKLGISLNCWFW